MCLYLVPGPVGSVSSIMDTTWAVISWSVPSYISSDYPIITYEIGYHILFDRCCCLVVDDDDIDIQALIQHNASSNSTSITITGLIGMSCYIFGVRAYTDNGYGEWTVIANETLISQNVCIGSNDKGTVVIHVNESIVYLYSTSTSNLFYNNCRSC